LFTYHVISAIFDQRGRELKGIHAYKPLLPGFFSPHEIPKLLPPLSKKAVALSCIVRQLRSHLGDSLWKQYL